MQTDTDRLWSAIREAGGIDAYVEAQLVAGGFAVARRPIDTMRPAQRKAYKAQLKQEAAERKRIRREAWAAHRANTIVHLGEGIHWPNAGPDERDHPRPAERRAENGLPELADPTALAEHLGVTLPQLVGMTYHRDAARSLHYRRFTIPRRDGSPRPIWAPLPRLMAAQRAVLRGIVEHLPVHGAAHGFVPGRSTASNAEVHADASVILKADLRDFFPTITLPRVKGIFRSAGYSEQIATLLALLCTESPREVAEIDGETFYLSLGPRCLPQGAPTSPALSNTLCLRLDRRLDGLARALGWRYTRYADDMTFSRPRGAEGEERLGGLKRGLAEITAAEGFVLHPDKTRTHRAGGCQTVTGLVVNGAQPPRTPRRLRRQIRAALHNLRRGRPTRETPEQLAGMIAYIAMTQPALGAALLEELRTAEQQSGKAR